MSSLKCHKYGTRSRPFRRLSTSEILIVLAGSPLIPAAFAYFASSYMCHLYPGQRFSQSLVKKSFPAHLRHISFKHAYQDIVDPVVHVE